MEAELIGALIGDGYISLACGGYVVGYTGHPVNDKEYYTYLAQLISSVWSKKVTPKVRCRGIRIAFCSKVVCQKLVGSYGMVSGASKSISVFIPKALVADWRLASATLRGLADTDGSVFFSKKPGVEKYPSLEITTSSIILAEQVRELLLIHGFRVTNLRSYFSKLSKHRTYKICLYGKENLRKWMGEIGFSNPYKRARAEALLSGD
jgi:hypothetical protein